MKAIDIIRQGHELAIKAAEEAGDLKEAERLRSAHVCLGCYRVHRPFFGPDSPSHHLSQHFCLTCMRNYPRDPDSWETFDRLAANAAQIAEAQEKQAS